MTRRLTGIHVFEKNGPIEWEPMLAAIQLISALSWKKHHGRIELYANEEWLDVLRKYGIDQIYDYIDTTELSKKNESINSTLYWSWPKMKIAKKLTPDHVMIDTDLWINSPIEVNDEMDFIGFHEETWSDLNPNNTYPDFDPLIMPNDLGRWDKTVRPINCALLWVNNSELLNLWLAEAEKIAISTGAGKLPDPNLSVHQVFIEQRLLPMIANELKLRYSTFLPIVYQSHIMDMGLGECWLPDPKTWSPEMIDAVKAFIHIWGCKKLWSHDELMKLHHCRLICEELGKYWKEFDISLATQAVMRILDGQGESDGSFDSD